MEESSISDSTSASPSFSFPSALPRKRGGKRASSDSRRYESDDSYNSDVKRGKYGERDLKQGNKQTKLPSTLFFSNNTLLSRGGGADKGQYAQVGPTETLHMMNEYLGADGREFCLSFAYWLSGSDPTIEIYTTRRRLINWQTQPEYITQKRVLWASYNQSITQDRWNHHRATFFGMNGGLFNIEVKVGERGFAGIDEIRGEYGPCK